jgi:hypothetical protein
VKSVSQIEARFSFHVNFREVGARCFSRALFTGEKAQVNT